MHIYNWCHSTLQAFIMYKTSAAKWQSMSYWLIPLLTHLIFRRTILLNCSVETGEITNSATSHFSLLASLPIFVPWLSIFTSYLYFPSSLLSRTSYFQFLIPCFEIDKHSLQQKLKLCRRFSVILYQFVLTYLFQSKFKLWWLYRGFLNRCLNFL